MTKGVAEKVTGDMKDAAGKLTGDKEFEGRRQAQKANGDVHNGVGAAKNAARNATKKAPDTSPSEGDITDDD